MKKILRPYQVKAVDSLQHKLTQFNQKILINASVGSGKSLIIAETLKRLSHKKILCLTLNSTLIKQNFLTYEEAGGEASIYCASLNKKEFDKNVVFASPQSITIAIKKNNLISSVFFDLIIVDEAHNINISNSNSMYSVIVANYTKINPNLNIVGLTGTPYRGKGYSIVGEEVGAFFKEEIVNISAEWLIKKNFLIKPRWGISESDLHYDFALLETNDMGIFDAEQLRNKVSENPRLTELIMHEVVNVVSNRNGAFIFATSIDHCYECAKHLPESLTAIITGKTSDNLREKYIRQAINGELKYLINVNVLSTGVDIPNFDTIVMVRPTESLVLYTQCIGRGMRLYPKKKDCLILDYAQNIERHGAFGESLIKRAYNKYYSEHPENFTNCRLCGFTNPLGTRRCKNIIKNKQCEYRFVYISCPECEQKIDIGCRKCPKCLFELIDPNIRLTIEAAQRKKKYYKGTLIYSEIYEGEDGIKVIYFLRFSQHKRIMQNVDVYDIPPEYEATDPTLTLHVDYKFGSDELYRDFPELRHRKRKKLGHKYIKSMLTYPKYIYIDKLTSDKCLVSEERILAQEMIKSLFTTDDYETIKDFKFNIVSTMGMRFKAMWDIESGEYENFYSLSIHGMTSCDVDEHYDFRLVHVVCFFDEEDHISFDSSRFRTFKVKLLNGLDGRKELQISEFYSETGEVYKPRCFDNLKNKHGELQLMETYVE